MTCKSCGSENLDKFEGEIALHFRGLKNLGKPIVWVFPVVSVCLNCGNGEFAVPENQLSMLGAGGSRIKETFESLGGTPKSSLDI